jgi:hypothetical protein
VRQKEFRTGIVNSGIALLMVLSYTGLIGLNFNVSHSTGIGNIDSFSAASIVYSDSGVKLGETIVHPSTAVFKSMKSAMSENGFFVPGNGNYLISNQPDYFVRQCQLLPARFS